MKYKDYYKIMEIEKTASNNEIKKAYRKLARKYHPDVSKEVEAEARFKEVGEAYKVLKDKEKRAAYDQLGSQWQAGDSFTPPPDWGQHQSAHNHGAGRAGGQYSDFANASGEDLSDFFSSIFGQASYSGGSYQNSRANLRGEDIHAKVEIDIEDAYRGSERTISFSLASPNEQGEVVQKQKTLNVKIPKGVKQGQHIRLSKQGGSSLGNGEAGDLYLEIVVKQHPVYQVTEKDVTISLPIAPWEAALGTKVEVPTPSGFLTLTIPANSKSGQKLRLKAKGIPAKSPGDLYVVLEIVNPEVKSDKAKKAFEQLAESFSFNARDQFKEKANAK
ncbi:MAG: curved DNA-binding protein [Enterobacterales bacterium]|jgi:curved DNA-binding protein